MIYDFDAGEGLTTSAPDFGQLVFSEINSFTANDFRISVLIIGIPYIGPNELLAEYFEVVSLDIGEPLVTHGVYAVSLEVDRPVLNPAHIYAQVYNLQANGVVVSSFTYEYNIIGLEKALYQEHSLIVDHFSISVPEFTEATYVEIPFYVFGIPYDEQYGQLVLYRSATGLEKAMADVDSERLAGITGIDAELIIDTWDPYYTFERNLPFLAWAYNIDLWEDGWSESTKREWTAIAMEFKAIRGTIGAIRIALDYAGRDFIDGISGYDLVDYMVPPQGFYASPDLTVEEYNSWIRLMPQVRIYLGNDPGEALGDEFFSDDGASDIHAASYDDGPELYGRKAILRQEGYDDINLRVIEHEEITVTYETIDWKEIRVPGVSVLGFFSDEDAVEEDKFVDWEEKEAVSYNIILDRSFDSHHTELHLSALWPGLEPITSTYERNSDVGEAGPFIYADDCFADIDFAEVDYGYLMLADYVYFNDPSVQAVMNKGVSFSDIDRVDFPDYTMELLVDLRTRDDLPVWYADESFVDEDFAADEDTSHIDRAFRAIRASKSLRDKALVAFDPLRPVEAGDYITESTTAEDWVNNQL